MYWFSAHGILIEYTHILVPVDGESEGTRDRCGRHIQPMRHYLRSTPVLFENFPLLYAKSVLLIDYHESEIRECDRFLDERMRTKYDIGLSTFESLASIFFHPRSE
jgi:hypothetical protein